MNILTLAHTKIIMDAAVTEGRKLKLPPLTVAVLDVGGHLKGMLREDNSSIMRPELAIAKAWGALGFGVSSRKLSVIAQERPMFMNALLTIADGKMAPVPGGVLIQNQTGDIIGSVGITGATSDEDEQCALAGIKAAGFVAQVDK